LVAGGVIPLGTANIAYKAVPGDYLLEQNYPNPFNAGTVIPFRLLNASEWTVTIYNVTGQVIRSFQGASAPGAVRVFWDGRTSQGREAPSGMYFYRVTTPTFAATKKMVLLK
jgi:hypothetical protein